MAQISLNNTTLQKPSSCGLDKVKSWIHDHPTTAKILIVCGLIFGFGLMLSIPFISPMLNPGGVIALAVSGCIISALAWTAMGCKKSQQIPEKKQMTAPEPKKAPIADLWRQLEEKTLPLADLDYLSDQEINHRFFNILCPRETAVSLHLTGQYLHANRVGHGIAQRSFIASQAPLDQDQEIFWRAIFENESTIIDLTTIKDHTHGGATRYYPTQINEELKYNTVSVKLIKKDEHTCTYRIKDPFTEGIKNIKRYHYHDWKDFNAVSVPELHKLIAKIETISQDPNDAFWIHCRAGVGRTGTLITSLILKEKIERGEVTKETLETSLVDIIINLRRQRGPAFVQQDVQLDLVRHYAWSLLE